MSTSLKAVLKGAGQRLKTRKPVQRFPALTWAKEKILKHQDDTAIKRMSFGKLKIEYIRPYEVLHTYKELFEDEIYLFDSTVANPLIIDCGANIGMSVLYFKSLYPKARVIAYEPDAANFDLLNRNIMLNNLVDIDCRQRAVWTDNKELLFDASGTQGSGISSDKYSKNTVRITADRLADVIARTPVDFLKIDIEGAEVDVVKDCQPFLSNVKNMFVEYHGKASEPGKLTELLLALQSHFQVYIKLAADNLKHPFTEKSTGASFDVQLNIFCYPL